MLSILHVNLLLHWINKILKAEEEGLRGKEQQLITISTTMHRIEGAWRWVIQSPTCCFVPQLLLCRTWSTPGSEVFCVNTDNIDQTCSATEQALRLFCNCKRLHEITPNSFGIVFSRLILIPQKYWNRLIALRHLRGSTYLGFRHYVFAILATQQCPILI